MVTFELYLGVISGGTVIVMTFYLKKRSVRHSGAMHSSDREGQEILADAGSIGPDKGDMDSMRFQSFLLLDGMKFSSMFSLHRSSLSYGSQQKGGMAIKKYGMWAISLFTLSPIASSLAVIGPLSISPSNFPLQLYVSKPHSLGSWI